MSALLDLMRRLGSDAALAAEYDSGKFATNHTIRAYD